MSLRHALLFLLLGAGLAFGCTTDFEHYRIGKGPARDGGTDGGATSPGDAGTRDSGTESTSDGGPTPPSPGDAGTRDGGATPPSPGDAGTRDSGTASTKCESDGDCDNGLYCDGAEVCDGDGECQAGAAPSCADGVACTIDSCDEGTTSCVFSANHALCTIDSAPICDSILGCIAVPCTDSASCDDDVFCNGVEVCEPNGPTSRCVPGAVPSCDDELSCTVDSCDGNVDRCLNTPDDAACDNGLFCDGEETCVEASGCQSGTAPTQDDLIGCTNEVCNEATDSIDHSPSNALCDDSLFCNGLEICTVDVGCGSGQAPNIDDGIPCTRDTCNEAANGIDHAPNHAACDNGLFCDGEETCVEASGCQSGTAPTQDDLIGCTNEVCNEATDSIDHSPSNALCDDSLFCNGSEICTVDVGCGSGTAPNLSDGVPCTADSCDEAADRILHTPTNVTLTVQGSTNGRVVSTPSGLDCSSSSCSASFSCGASVSLTSTVWQDSGYGFAGWSGGGCSGLEGCTTTLDDNGSVTAAFSPANKVFVTAASYTGDLGGVKGANAKCQTQAASAGLSGTYVAWVSTPTYDAKDGLGSARGWANTDGSLFSDAIIDQAILYPPRTDQDGIDLGEVTTFSNTWPTGLMYPYGDPVAYTCDSWTDDSLSGGPGGATGIADWSFGGGSGACASPRHLHCLGIDETVAIRPERTAGRLAFVTQFWVPQGGLAGADAECARAASNSGIAGSFKALLATTGASAASRFNTVGEAPWVRLDGIPLASTASGFFDDPQIGLVMTSGDTYSGYWIFTGMDNGPHQVGIATCDDWTSSSPDLDARMGVAVDPAQAFTSNFAFECSVSRSLYCLEE